MTLLVQILAITTLFALALAFICWKQAMECAKFGKEQSEETIAYHDALMQALRRFDEIGEAFPGTAQVVMDAVNEISAVFPKSKRDD